MAESDFSRPCIIGYGSSPSRCGPAAIAEAVDREISRFPRKERLHMPGSLITPGRPGLALSRPDMLPSTLCTASAPQNETPIAAQWLACAPPCQRFAEALAGHCA